MTGRESRAGWTVGLLASFTVHLLAAAVAFGPGVEPGTSASFSELARGDHAELGRWLNHLWQSTLFAAAGLLTLVFRRNHARVRYWLWFSTSVKFLVPFSWLLAMGGRLRWESPADAAPAPVSIALTQIGQPFVESGASGLVPVLSAPPSAGWLALAVLGAWLCGCVVIAGIRYGQWRRIRHAVRRSAAVTVASAVLPPDVSVRSAPGVLEPGVVGFWRPIILMPAGIDDYLTPAQLDTVLAHEVCHVRHRDNLTAAVHMAVEAVFWFHPLVWWIGARLVHERERACDEDVLRTVDDPRTYAVGLLNVCKRYVDARLACMSGAGGSDLTKRIEAIMTNQRSERLGGWRRFLLATAGLAAIAGPLAVGVLTIPSPLRAEAPAPAPDWASAPGSAPGLTSAPGSASGPAQVPVPATALPAFDAASITPNTSGDRRAALSPRPGGQFTATNVTVAMLIRFAYDLPSFLISGGPAWLDDDRFDVSARAAGNPPLSRTRLMMRRLLAERFQLTAHLESRELPVYVLVMAGPGGTMGPKLRRAAADCARAEQPSMDGPVGPSPSTGPPACGYFGFAPGTDFASGRAGLSVRGVTMTALANRLVPILRRPVQDQTGLDGFFDADFDPIAELPMPPPPPGTPNPFTTPFASVFSVLPEQLGLALDARRAPVDVLIVDHAEPPAAN